MTCKDAKDWYTCYATVGLELILISLFHCLKWAGWLVIIPLLVIFGSPLALLGWIMENRK